jgi:hypothetical protein
LLGLTGGAATASGISGVSGAMIVASYRSAVTSIFTGSRNRGSIFISNRINDNDIRAIVIATKKRW